MEDQELPQMRLHASHRVLNGTGYAVRPLSMEEVTSVFMDVPNEVRPATPSISSVAESNNPSLAAAIPVRLHGRHLFLCPTPGGLRMPIRVALLLARVMHGIDAATGDALLLVSQRGTNWLIVVQGPHFAAKKVLAAISSAGGIRSDFAACYRLLKKQLGSGSNAIVYSAMRRSDKNVDEDSVLHAVKIPSVHWQTHHADLPAVWLKELEMLAFCQGHPNILKLHSAFYCGSGISHGESEAGKTAQWAIVTELCKNGDLFNWIVSSKGLPEQLAKKTVLGILQGLDFMQCVGVIHRDVKPENVLLRRDGRPVLADFGLACRMSDEEELHRRCGSPGYIAPEVYAGKCCSRNMDVFSTGALLYFALSRNLPFTGRTSTLTRSNTLKGKLDFTRNDVFLHVTGGCRKFISRLLAHDAERPMAGEALRDLWLQGHVRGETMPTPHSRNLQDRNRKVCKEHLQCALITSQGLQGL